MVAYDIDKAAIDFAKQRKIQPANRFHLENRLDGARSNNRFSHSKNRLPGERCVIAKAKKVQLVQGNRLRIEVENGVGVSGLNFHRMRRVHHLHVSTGTPCTTELAHSVNIPTHAPILSVLRPHECSAEAESVLRRHAARCDVYRMVGKQGVPATGYGLEVKRPAGVGDALAFSSQFSL